MSAVDFFFLLARNKVLGLKNSVLDQGFWDWVKKSLFGLAGLAVLVGLFHGFVRVLHMLESIELIGPLLTWKLTAMALMTTFWMVVVSNLIAAVSTLYFANDLRFLLITPIPPRTVFFMKAVEASAYASWMVGLALVPFILALAKVKALGWAFSAVFIGLSVPFLALAAFGGILMTMALLYFFPSSRTRDALWIMSSVALALVYIVVRLAQPERLVRPDALEVVAQYLQFLQAPTAPYLPSWWMTEALQGWAAGNPFMFASRALALSAGAAAAYSLLAGLAGPMYLKGVSGAQEGSRSGRGWDVEPYFEEALKEKLGLRSMVPVLYWKDRKLFARDVKHWSQLLLILALVVVYIFSIWRLPLDTTYLRSLAAFLNLGAAGFVMAALGLRFTFPAVSTEGKAYWVCRSAPISTGTLLAGKFFLSVVPMTALGGVIILFTNHLLQADRFTSVLSFATMLLCTWTLCGMGVGFGAIFPKFDVENLHQIESSAGGFAYMACAMGYIGVTLALEAPLVQLHFWIRMGQLQAFDRPTLIWCLGSLALLNLAAFLIPWFVGLKLLDGYEGE